MILLWQSITYLSVISKNKYNHVGLWLGSCHLEALDIDYSDRSRSVDRGRNDTLFEVESVSSWTIRGRCRCLPPLCIVISVHFSRWGGEVEERDSSVLPDLINLFRNIIFYIRKSLKDDDSLEWPTMKLPRHFLSAELYELSFPKHQITSVSQKMRSCPTPLQSWLLLLQHPL